MKTLIQNFIPQVNEAKSIGDHAKLKDSNKTISSVLITGMGGSGIGGTIMSDLATEVQVPILVNKSYELPSWVNENTLVIGSTYSGNTEETISVTEKALAVGAELVFITSGGKALEMCVENGLNVIELPGGNPPRSMLAYSLISVMYMLNHYKVTSFNIEKELSELVQLIEKEDSNIIAEATQIAEKIQNTMPIVYGIHGYDGVAERFRQQINENAKMLCWHHIIPEMNHNELVGWAGAGNNLSVVILRNEDDSTQNQKRIEINKTIFKNYTDNIIEIWGKGSTKFVRSMYHIHLEDWISLVLSELNQVDVVEVKVIDFLKSELGK